MLKEIRTILKGQERIHESTYICDMCGKELSLNETNKYSRIKGIKTQKLYDLCDKCNSILTKSVMNYAKKHKKEE